MQQRAARWLAALVYSAAAVGGAWLLVRFVLPWTAPFLLAFAVAAVLEFPVRALVRHGWKRSLASAVLTLAVLGLLAWLAVKLTVWGVSAVNSFAGEVPALMEALTENLTRLESRAFAYVSAAPDGVGQYLETAIRSIGESFYDLPAVLSQWALDMLAEAAQSSPDALLFLVTAGIGSYFFSASYPAVLAFLKAQLPQSVHRRWAGMGQNMKASFGGMFRAQLILMGLTFFQLLLGFLLMKIENAAALAALTALIDALPVFGTGIVLIPWGLYCLLLGHSDRGIALLICWVLVTLVRNCAQAKLVGDQIGLDPIASLLAVYVGWQVWGVGGMLLFPVLFVALQQLNERGLISLWKNP